MHLQLVLLVFDCEDGLAVSRRFGIVVCLFFASSTGLVLHLPLLELIEVLLLLELKGKAEGLMSELDVMTADVLIIVVVF